MFRAMIICVVTLSSFVTASAATPVGEFSPADCPKGTYLLRVVPADAPVSVSSVEVLVRSVNTGHPLPNYLYRRADGWTHLSSEIVGHRPGTVVSNCLPEGLYHVRIEYYTQKPFVGSWLVAVFGYTAGINEAGSTVVDGFWYDVTMRDHLSSHGTLFLFYGVLGAAIIFLTILFVRRLRASLRAHSRK